MALVHSPNIVTDGIVLYLDAANPKSYPGSGTNWHDLTKNNSTFELENGPTHTTNNSGSFSFDGTNDYARSDIFYTSRFFVENQDFTVMSFNMATSTMPGNGRSGIFANQRYISEPNPGGFGINIHPTDQYCMNLTHDDGAGTKVSYQNQVQIPIVLNEKCCITYTFTNSDNTIRGYKNNSLVESTTNTSYKWSPREANLSRTVIGTSSQGGWGNVFPGEIYNVFVYDRALTAEEVSQNFNALRGRYGI